MPGGQFPGGDHGLAAASATVADKIHILPHILAELNEIMVIGLLQEVKTFFFIYFPGDKISGKTRVCGLWNFLSNYIDLL
jgi:hypothetical protein